MDGTETGWGRPAEPAPRWRALLDRARHGRGTTEEEPSSPPAPPAAPPSEFGQPLPTRRPYNPLDTRPLLAGVPDLGPGPSVQLWPHRHGTDAMFCAVLRRR